MTDNIYDYFNNVISKDLFDTFCSTQLGEGAYRKVYRLTLTPEYVVKIEAGAFNFSNIHEWDVWERVKHTKHAKWFAPCEHISPCGTVLVQKFCKDIDDDALLPEEVPAFFTDIKKSNFGMLNNNIVCRDYGFNLLMEKGMTSRMKKAEW